MAFCKFCGSAIPDKAEFCPECGKKAPGGNHGVSPLTRQESSAQEPLSRKEFCDMSFSPSAKKWIRTNWIAFAMAVILRMVMIPVNAVLMMPGAVRGQYMGYAFSGLIFSAAGLCILMLLSACVTKHWGFAAVALFLAAYKALVIYTIPLAIGNGAMLISAVIILANARKLEKEYQAYLNRAVPGSAKK